MTVYKKGKVYHMDFIVEGRRVNKSTRCRRKTAALDVEKQEYEKLRQQILDEEQTYNPCILLSEAVEDVYRERWSGQPSGDRARAYVLSIVREFGDIALEDIDKRWVRKVATRLSRDRSPATVNRYLANLRVVLNWARDEWNALERVPPIRLYRESTGRTRVISPQEQRELTEHLRNNYHVQQQWYWPIVADLIDFLCETGLRLSEALHLTPKNFRRDGAIELFPEDTKTNAARTVPLSNRAQEIIQQRGQRPFRDIDQFQASRAFKHAREAIGVNERDFCLHACRHTFASRLLASGRVQLLHVKKLLGHTAWQTTERYSHFAVSELKDAVSVLDT